MSKHSVPIKISPELAGPNVLAACIQKIITNSRAIVLLIHKAQFAVCTRVGPQVTIFGHSLISDAFQWEYTNWLLVLIIYYYFLLLLFDWQRQIYFHAWNLSFKNLKWIKSRFPNQIFKTFKMSGPGIPPKMQQWLGGGQKWRTLRNPPYSRRRLYKVKVKANNETTRTSACTMEPPQQLIKSKTDNANQTHKCVQCKHWAQCARP